MKIIRTILGDIDPKEMGTVDAHDHLIRSGGPEIAINKAFLMNDVDAADREFKNYIKAGGKTMVCMDPIGCGRNVKKMLEVAERNRGKGHLLMTTGFQKGSLYCPETSFLATVDTNKVAQMMIAEITEGMDIHSYNGPVVERTKAKAGLIKAGTSYRIVTKLEQKAINVASITQKETGCAISFHTDYGTMALEDVEFVKKFGGNPEKTLLCHMQRNLDKYYYEKVFQTGASICFDEANKAMYRPDSAIAEVIKYLVDKGYEKQILIGMDGGMATALSEYMANEGMANGLDYLYSRFVPLLKEVGISDRAIENITVNNAANLFAIEV